MSITLEQVKTALQTHFESWWQERKFFKDNPLFSKYNRDLEPGSPKLTWNSEEGIIFNERFIGKAKGIGVRIINWDYLKQLALKPISDDQILKHKPWLKPPDRILIKY